MVLCKAYIGPLTSFMQKGNSMCISLETEIFEFVHIIIIHNIISFHWPTAFDFNFYSKKLHNLAH